MEERDPRNRLDIKVEVDTDEAQERIERLKTAVEGLAGAFDKLTKVVTEFGASINIVNGQEIIKSVEKEMEQLRAIRDDKEEKR